MIILGIDPGIAIVGWGVIDYGGIGTKSKVLNYGAITTPATMKTEDRIYEVHRELTAIIKAYKPEAAAIEELFFNTNQNREAASYLHVDRITCRFTSTPPCR